LWKGIVFYWFKSIIFKGFCKKKVEEEFYMKMKSNYKLYHLIEVLTKSEIRQVRKMAISPFFLERTDVGRMFNFLVDEWLEGKKLPEKETVFKHTFPHKKFNDLQLRGTMSDLVELIEEFLLIQNRRNNKIVTKLQLAKIYRNRKLEKSYLGTVKKTENLITIHPKRNAAYFQNVLDFQLEGMEFKIATKRSDDLKFQEISDTWDVLYLIQKLRHVCAQLSHQPIIKQDYDFGLLSDLVKTVEQKKYIEVPAIAMYYYCYRFLTEEFNLDFFQKFREQLTNYRHLFSKRELQDPYRLAINFCIRKLNRGDKFFLEEGLKLYKEGLAEGILLENNFLPRFSYNNMIALAIKLEEFDWVEKFIETSSDLLETKYRKSTISFNLARLEYARKNYGKAMLHLQGGEYKDLLNNLIAKSLLMKIYYELGEYDSLFSHLDSFQIFIRRREVSDFHRKNYMNAIRLVKKLVALPELDKEARKSLKKQIEEEEVLPEREWLLGKL
jgi:hypothetical protein